MSTRDDILAALTDAPEGLTTRELAPLCPSAECDAQIVGRVVSAMRGENVIHAGSALREGGTVWIFGPGKREEPIERVTLPYVPNPKSSTEAARAISELRRGSRAAAEVPAARAQRTPPPTTTRPAAAPAAPAQREEEESDMKAKVLKAIAAADGGLSRPQVIAIAGKEADQVIAELVKDKSIKRIGRARGTRYVPHVYVPKPQRSLKVKKARAARAERDIPSAPARAANGHAAFAINEAGELGIEKKGARLDLDAAEFQRLRTFIERSKNVWAE